jgi:uncharacterized protein YndB with AHSA1/START domain
MRTTVLLAAALASFIVGTAFAGVADSSASGFTVKIAVHVQAPPAEAYRKFVRNIGDWWNSSHTFSGSAKNLSIEEKAAGCFCEKLPDGGGVRHMEVVTIMPGKMIVMTGALGPMQSLAAAGNMKVQFSSEEGGTKFEMTYSVVGYLATGMNTFAGPSDGMLTEQVTRFKNYVEAGK